MARFNEEFVKMPFGGKVLEGVLSVPASPKADTAVLLTHGAGGNMNFRHLVVLAHFLAAKGLICVRFACKSLNLDIKVRAYRAVWDYLRSLQKFEIAHLFLGGRSMGCRAAVVLSRQLSDESLAAMRGVICVSFPLHPPGQKQAHQRCSQDLRLLPETVRVLFVLGTEGNMCDREPFEQTLKEMKAQVEVLWLQGGSHGLTVKGRSESSVMDEVNAKVISWLNESTSGD